LKQKMPVEIESVGATNVKKQTEFIEILTNYGKKKKHSKINYKDRNNLRIFILSN